ncbi:MAG: IgGFc-binding protein [Myxococcales bacterium]|nr:IgGFc-binding protein [Myxococcales bacterium]
MAALGALHCGAGGSRQDPSGSGASGVGGAGVDGGHDGMGGDGVSVGAGAGPVEGPDCEGSDAKTSSGCDYYALVPDVSFGAAGGCYAAFVVNPWEIDVTVEVTYDGMSLDPAAFGFIPSGAGASMQYTPLVGNTIPGGEVAILFLNRFGVSPLGLNTDCPPGIVPAITTFDAAPHNTTIGRAFHIQTSSRVVAYDIYPYGGGQSALTSATLLLPTTSWGDNYIAVSAFGDGAGFGGIGSFPVTAIVAHQDDTTVTINPRVAIEGGNGVAATAQGVPQSYTLGSGQVLQLAQAQALDGSVIQSNLPVGVWGGKTTLGIEECCDESAHQQIPPIRALGSEYVGVRYRNRYDGIEETPPWRIIGAVDGTTLTWEPAPPPGAPTSLALGQVAQFSAAGPFVVRSQDAQHPFYMSAHMTGASLYDPDPMGDSDGRGDAEFVNVIPPGEYLDRYVFFTDPTYPETNLVVVRHKGPSGFSDVTLDCAGTLGGWQPIGGGNYEYTYVDLVRGNFVPQGACDNGRHEIWSDQPFGLTVWGWGSAATGSALSGFYTQYVSYAYPGGASVAPINEVVIPPIR